MNILFRYISRRVLLSILLTFLIVIGIIMLVDFVEATRNFDDGEFSSLTILWLTLLKTPQLIEETIPFIALFGMMGALFGLNRRSELIVMRASGVSAWRFLLPAVLVAGLIGIIWTVALNPLASASMELREKIISQNSDTHSLRGLDTSLWLREGNEFEQTVIHAPSSNMLSQTLYDAEFIFFQTNADGELAFSRRMDAAQATLLPSGYWQLSQVIENTSDLKMQKIDSISWPTTITRQTLQNQSKSGSLPPFWNLMGEIKSLAKAGFSTTALEMKLHKLLSLPLMLIAMTCLAACVSMRLSREGGAFRLLLAGGILGFSVYFLQNMVGAFGEAGVVNLYIAVWSVPLLVLFGASAYLSRIEDG